MIFGENNEKMSKLKGNVVNSDEIVESYGVDMFCFYEMFMGFLDVLIVWLIKGFDGVCCFLDCVWCLFVDDNGELSSKV